MIEDYIISHLPPPIPDRRHDYQAVHKDYDGPGDPRCFTGESPEDIKQQIEEFESDD